MASGLSRAASSLGSTTNGIPEETYRDSSQIDWLAQIFQMATQRW